MIKREPQISVGLMERQPRIQGRLNGIFHTDQNVQCTGDFKVHASEGIVVLSLASGEEIKGPQKVVLTASGKASFMLAGVTIGIDFHWQRKENLEYRGNLKILAHEDDTVTVVNEILLEDYLASVISSEMSESAPLEFLKAHAIMSRSWLVAMLLKNKASGNETESSMSSADEIVRWYSREDHRHFDVCSDDHCQRYQGITRAASGRPAEAAAETRGRFLVFEGKICDARYYKACGGLTENFENAWENKRVPYLTCISDSPVRHEPIRTEEEARDWLLSSPEAFCHVTDDAVLRQVLPAFDQSTGDFFRWQAVYARADLENILKDKSGIDFGTLTDLVPLSRGPSGRIFRLQITGTKRTVVVGKELEIRRWLSPSHLLSSAFIVLTERDPSGVPERFILKGGGWGHGVGLCQIGAAVMALKGFSAEEILAHYFRDTRIEKLY